MQLLDRNAPCLRWIQEFVVFDNNAYVGLNSHVQAGHWKDSISLFTHAIDVTTDDWLARNNLGFSLVQ